MGLTHANGKPYNGPLKRNRHYHRGADCAGLNVQQRTEASGPNGGPIETEATLIL